MFKVTGMKSGVVWDAETNKPLIGFKGGTAETEDQAVAEKLKGLGYAVEGDFKEPDPMAAMTVKDLIAYAEEKKIDLGDKTKKADILAVIKAAELKE